MDNVKQTLSLQEQLERLVDLTSMSLVLSALSEIADAKCEHVHTNWQDRGLAMRWGRMCTNLARAAEQARELKL